MNDDKKTRKAPAFQFYADDFLAGTITMTNEERGAYIALLCIQWSKGSLTENDFQRVCIGMPPHSQRICQDKFQIDADGNYRNKRLEAEREKQDQYRKKQTDNANKRWVGNATAYATALPADMPNVCSPSPTPTPKEDTNAPKSPNRLTVDLSPELEAFRLRVGAMVRRRPETKWSPKELKALKEVFELNTPEEDIKLVEARYRSDDKYLRRELYTLLNNWNGEVDKVRNVSAQFQVEAPAHLSLDLKDYL